MLEYLIKYLPHPYKFYDFLYKKSQTFSHSAANAESETEGRQKWRATIYICS